MSIAKNARASQVMADIKSGKHTPANKQGKFANYGSVAEDSIYYTTKLCSKKQMQFVSHESKQAEQD